MDQKGQRDELTRRVQLCSLSDSPGMASKAGPFTLEALTEGKANIPMWPANRLAQEEPLLHGLCLPGVGPQVFTGQLEFGTVEFLLHARSGEW